MVRDSSALMHDLLLAVLYPTFTYGWLHCAKMSVKVFNASNGRKPTNG